MYKTTQFHWTITGKHNIIRVISSKLCCVAVLIPQCSYNQIFSKTEFDCKGRQNSTRHFKVSD